MLYLVAFLAGFAAAWFIRGRPPSKGSVKAGRVRLTYPVTWTPGEVAGVLDRAARLDGKELPSVDVDLTELNKPDRPSSRRPVGFHSG